MSEVTVLSRAAEIVDNLIDKINKSKTWKTLQQGLPEAPQEEKDPVESSLVDAFKTCMVRDQTRRSPCAFRYGVHCGKFAAGLAFPYKTTSLLTKRQAFKGSWSSRFIRRSHTLRRWLIYWGLHRSRDGFTLSYWRWTSHGEICRNC